MQDRFVSPKPIFRDTTNQSAKEAITPNPKDNTPSLSVVDRLHQAGNHHLASLLQEAQQQAKQHATQTDVRAGGRKGSHKERDSQHRLPHFDETVRFQPSDVLSDREFIRRTRDSNLHTPEMRALFWANGGGKHMTNGLSYAQAFDALRREKLKLLQGEKTSAPYQRHTNVAPGIKSITPGTPTQQDRERKMLAAMVKEEKS